MTRMLRLDLFCCCRRPLAVGALYVGVATIGNSLAADGSLKPFEEAQADSQRTDLLAVLDEVTQLATKSRLNVDYVPGIMTVLEREEILALGARTVADALTLVPGVLVERGGDGAVKLSVRGQDNSTGTVKILIDSVPMNTSYAGLALFDGMPVEQLERIEVIRGPGSALYGEFAFSGVVNIVTLQRTRRLHTRYGDANTTQVGGVYSIEDPERKLSLTMNLAGWDSRGLGVDSGTDRLYALGLGDYSRAPGEVNDGENYRFGQMQFAMGDFTVLAQQQSTRRQTFFGGLNVLPGAMRRGGEGTDLENWVIQAGYRFSPSERSRVELKVHWHEDWEGLDQRLAPAGVPVLLVSGPVLTEDLRQETYAHSRRVQMDAAFEWDGWMDHRVRFEVNLAEDKLIDSWWAYNIDLITFEPLSYMRRYTGEANSIDPDAGRTIKSLVLQDQWSPRADFDLTLGLRYDTYSDVGDNLSPRLAAVWRLTNQHLVKMQVASAFFPPSLLQRHFQSSLPVFETARDPETIRTVEIGYIFRRSDTVWRISAYYSRLYDLITSYGSTWVNLGEARTQGAELEWQQAFGHKFKLMGNLSYADTLDKEAGGPIPGAATWLGNLGIFYRPMADVLVAGRWNYVGDRARAAGDSRSALSGYSDVSLTLSWFDVGSKGFDVRLGLTNLLGENIRSPAPALTYEADYLVEDERTAWVQFSYTWP